MDNKKYSYCGPYLLKKTLGAGYNSKVKLGYDTISQQHVALKIIKHSHPKLNIKTIRKEIETLQQLKHSNIISLIDFSENVEVVKRSGKTYPAVCIVMELVPNGELFEYVAVGKFSEKIARTYFQILLDTLEFCHSEGFAHRDLKPENLLLDENFNLKIADFGFATILAGKDGSGQLNTFLGTEGYMAPEIHLRQPYSGPAVDLFAAAIILFIMHAGTPPFIRADPQKDQHYKLLCINKHDQFWTMHEANKPKNPGQNYFSEEFKDLVNSMLALDPAVRMTISEVKSHPWYTGEIVTLEELQAEFTKRKQYVDARIDKERKMHEQKKLAIKQHAQKTNINPTAFTGIQVFRSLEKEMKDELNSQLKNQLDLKKERVAKDFVSEGGSHPQTQIKTMFSPDYMFMHLVGYISREFNEFSVSDTSYKIKCKAVRKDETVELGIEVTKVDENVSCIEFTKKKGPVIAFYEIINEVKNSIPQVEETNEEK